MTNTNTKALHDQLNGLWAQFMELATRADDESKHDGKPLAETSTGLARLSDALDRLEAQMGQADLAPTSVGEVVLNGTVYAYPRGTAEHARFTKVLREGMPRNEAAKDRVKLAELTPEQKAMSLADDTTGGYGASSEFANDLLRAMADASPVRQVVRVLPTGGSGALVPVRTGIATAKRISETGTRVQTTADLSFRLEQVPTPEMYADTAVSNHLLADSAYPIDRELLDASSRSFALLEGKEFISGTGVGELLGLDATTLPAANVVTCADATGHLVGADDLHKLLYESFKAAYLPGARLLLHPKLLGKLRQLKATSGASYLFPSNDPPGYIAGFPYTLMPDMADNATPAAGKAVAYLLHPSAYALVVRQDITVQRLTEMFAEVGKTAFMVWQRVGGQVVLAEAVARLVTG